MPIVELFSNRDRQDPDVWNFDEAPLKLRVQISQIIEKALGPRFISPSIGSESSYEIIEETVAHEHGLDTLGPGRDAGERIHRCIRLGPVDLFLDVLEYTCKYLLTVVASYNYYTIQHRQLSIRPSDAVSEINERCRRAGFGYRYENQMLARIDNELLHQVITRPALKILSDPRFSGADTEYREAHEHFKSSELRDCAVDCLNALESTMKIICDLKGWEYNRGARASDLLKILRNKELFPAYADGSFEQLFATLKSGLPALRNEVGGHGAGAEVPRIPQYVATYALHLSGAKIRFLYEAFEESGGAVE